METEELAELYVEMMKIALTNHPNPTLIFAARYLMGKFDRELLPDWVAALAGGSFDHWRAAIEEALHEMRLAE